MVLDLLQQSDKAGLYRDSAVGLGEFVRIEETAFRHSAQKIRSVADRLSGLQVYYSIVPDKSVFAQKAMPGYDHARAEEILQQELAGYSYIPLKEKLSAPLFYKTDLHWDQTKITGIADHLLSSMGAGTERTEYPLITAGEFRGVYAGQLALPIGPDRMTYRDISGRKAQYLNDKTLAFEEGAVHDPERFLDIDPYDLFLRGPQPLIILENQASAQERELYLFRDSFGSSLASLFMNAYSKITIIDLRYIHADLLEEFITFTPGADVLFLYSSQIFNNPSILQV
jgi:hypothetical protein